VIIVVGLLDFDFRGAREGAVFGFFVSLADKGSSGLGLGVWKCLEWIGEVWLSLVDQLRS